MKRVLLFCFFISFLLSVNGQPKDYEWRTPSKNSSESMPCGGGDIGMNVWVEDGDVLFYLSRSGCFDENNTLLKLGRFRVHLSKPFALSSFRQQLVLKDGYVQVTDGQKWVQIWADVNKPVVHVEVSIEKELTDVDVTYESWRTHDREITHRERFQTSYKFSAPQGLTTKRDSIIAATDGLTFVHQNGEQTIFDVTVTQQQMDAVKDRLYNPLKNLIFGGRLHGDQFVLKGTTQGRYASSDYQGWTYSSKRPAQRHAFTIALATKQGSFADWLSLLRETERQIQTKRDWKQTRDWWHQFWQRSYVEMKEGTLARNYTLFRYMLGCNSRGGWPTKFNGGLFTFDPEYVEKAPEYRLTPDYRNWGGGVHTSQNQRLVYWPMLKNGDFDMLCPQLDFYLRIYPNAEERSRLYWGHEGACITEQVENYGLPCYPEYGTKRPAGFDPGVERNAWLEYEWDTCLEFCMMALEAHRYSGMNIDRYLPMIRSCLRFFDEHYQYLANMRGAKRLDGNGKLVLYPGSGGETYKMAYNSTSTIAALRTVAEAIGDTALLGRLPDITIRDGKIQPALHYERVNNTETMQLYPVFPWRMYGVGRPNLDIARNTYLNDSLAIQFRSHVGWKQDLIWAACLGLTDEARRLLELKMGDGPHRFPAFWGPGFDWSPDHNWGGSGMIGMQEMLMQEAGNKIYLFPAWPREWDVRFKLHASDNTIVEAELQGGKVVNVKVTPQSRQQDIVYETK
ncbi:hypothetical protein SAMN04487851_10948 [Prevotella sp. tc2-28]|uniref:DUF5703 domain-containing protein n=1 Tax=Prevotella sp. tc2-28 TaxID=1761888 RepID=UPI00089653FF|nr:DUF5703 domain-containing protein [Prevotella sp. tc2-28]SEA59408.1 hypothetical protein SAMN04487851_10948 [Prevotella sp. tc2-28]